MTPELRVSDVEVGLAKLLVEMNAIDGVDTPPLVVEIAEAVPTDPSARQRLSIAQLETQLAQVGAVTADNSQKVVGLDSKIREMEAAQALPKRAKRLQRELADRRRLLGAVRRRALP